jgi:hypothetical protein
MARSGAPPKNEIGAVANIGVVPWTTFVTDEFEEVPELIFPQSVRTYHAMRNDSQIEGLYAGATWPILRYKWMLDPNGCDPEKVRTLAKDLQLPVKGADPEPKGRSKNRFVFKKHLEDALRSILYGFYMFEQVGEIEDDGLWHLRRLAERPPNTINTIRLSQTGGIVTIVQNVTNQQTMQGGLLPEIPIDRLVVYPWDKEGANWYGRSMLRGIYRNWLIKDRLMRVDAIKHERNGVGVPIGIGAAGYTKGDLQRLATMAQSFKAGESSGGAIPFGTDLKLLGVEGKIPDTIGSINFHNEEMARRFLFMFMQLGSTMHGSRALGSDFLDYFQLAQEHLANWFRDIFNEHVIEDYWDWNYGDGEEFAPLLTYQRDDDPRFAAADLALMVQNGVIVVDDEIEKSVREAMDLPDRDESTARYWIQQGWVTESDPNNPQPEGQPSNLPGQVPPAATTARKGAAPGSGHSPAAPGASVWLPNIFRRNDV